jgi:hypothetical protein
MIWYTAQYRWRGRGSGGWGHTVQFVQPEFKSTDFGTTVDPDELEEIILWAEQNAQARRISYDTWQFKTRNEADQFIMLFKLRWG